MAQLEAGLSKKVAQLKAGLGKGISFKLRQEAFNTYKSDNPTGEELTRRVISEPQ